MALLRPCFTPTTVVVVTLLSLVVVSAAPKVQNLHRTVQSEARHEQKGAMVAPGMKESKETDAAGTHAEPKPTPATSPYLPLALWSRARATLEANQQKIAHLTATPGYHLALFAHSNSPLKKQLTPLWDAAQLAYPLLNFTSVDTRLLPS
eukprot:TRINITY_DN9229_c0_g1_i2.p1 TRINITY_DN9229_c0_g1~~TRINITY_DN9229_c0_g1_i2.p1  ORF type:complete len:150 (+),score=1.30 TRINITY_DN9229_c0_g1_i2:291-740(+)